MIVLLFRLVVVLVDLFTVAFTIAATASFVWGLARFLKAAPSAIRQDLADRRGREAGWRPPVHHVRNEVEPPAALPPKILDPRALMPGPEEDPGGRRGMTGPTLRLPPPQGPDWVRRGPGRSSAPFREDYAHEVARLEDIRILWVDDRPSNNAFLSDLLREHGATIVEATSNDEALERARDNGIDVLISDIDRDRAEPGSELGLRLWASGQNIPIVHFVGHVDPGQPPPVGSLGVTNDANRLLELIYEAVGRTP